MSTPALGMVISGVREHPFQVQVEDPSVAGDDERLLEALCAQVAPFQEDAPFQAERVVGADGTELLLTDLPTTGIARLEGAWWSDFLVTVPIAPDAWAVLDESGRHGVVSAALGAPDAAGTRISLREAVPAEAEDDSDLFEAFGPDAHLFADDEDEEGGLEGGVGDAEAEGESEEW